MASSSGNESSSSSVSNSVLSCPVCYEEGAQLDLRVLICGHLLCCPCAMRLASVQRLSAGASASRSNNRTIACPLCRSSQISHVGGNLILAQLPIALKDVLKNRAQKQKCNQCESRLRRDDFMHCKACVIMVCGKCAFRSHKACEGVVDYNDFAQEQCNAFKPKLEAMSADSNQLHDQIKSAETYFTEMASIARNYAKMLTPPVTGGRLSHEDSPLTAQISAVAAGLDDFKEASWPPSSLNTTEVRIDQISLKLESIKPAVANFLMVQQATKDKDDGLTRSIRQQFHSIRNGRNGNQESGPSDASIPNDQPAVSASDNMQEAPVVAVSSADDIPNYQPSGSGVRLRMAYSPTRPSLSALRDTTEEATSTRSRAGPSQSSFQVRVASSTTAPASPIADDLAVLFPPHTNGGIFQSNDDNYDESVNFFEMEPDNLIASPIPTDDPDGEILGPLRFSPSSPTSPTNSIGFASSAVIGGSASPGWISPVLTGALQSPVVERPEFRRLMVPPRSSPVVSSSVRVPRERIWNHGLVHPSPATGDYLTLVDIHNEGERGSSNNSDSRRNSQMDSRSFEREFAEQFRRNYANRPSASATSRSSARNRLWNHDGIASSLQQSSSSTPFSLPVEEGTTSNNGAMMLDMVDEDDVRPVSPIITRGRHHHETSASDDTPSADNAASSSSRRRVVDLRDSEHRRRRENTSSQFAVKRIRKQ